MKAIRVIIFFAIGLLATNLLVAQVSEVKAKIPADSRSSALKQTLTGWLSSRSISVPANFDTDGMQTADELRVIWKSDTKETDTVNTSGIIQASVTQRIAKRGKMPHIRSLEFGNGMLLAAAVGPNGNLLGCAIISDPRFVRTDSPDPDGKLSGEIVKLSGAEFLLPIPSDSNVVSVHLYERKESGLNEVAYIPVPAARHETFSSNAAPVPIVPVLINGDSSNRIDVLFLGDGYVAAELPTFAADVERFIAGATSQKPFNEYQQYFNIRRIDIASAESGATHPDYPPKNTAFGAYFGCGTSSFRGICADMSKVEAVLSTVPLEQRDAVVLVVNDSIRAGSGGSIAIVTNTPELTELVLHEFGHSFGALADEYVESSSCFGTFEPIEPNATMETRRGEIKWRAWIDPTTPIPTGDLPPSGNPDAIPGLYLGARYCATGLYRPTADSKMRTLGIPYWQINTEQLIKRFYTFVDPIDSHTPPNEDYVDSRLSQTFTVTTLVPSTHTLEVEWRLDGAPQLPQSAPPQLQFSLHAHTVTTGLHTLEAIVSDKTPWVRSDPNALLTGNTIWTLSDKLMPHITWPAPESIPYGIPLSETELNATSTVPGMFAYNPPAGTVLTGGLHTLSVTFTPTDSTEYLTATATVSINVLVQIPAINDISPVIIKAGTPGLNLLVDVTNFSAGAIVQWNGSPRTTTAKSATQLEASIPAADVATYGIVAVTVANPASSGGGVSKYFSAVIDSAANAPGAFTVSSATTTLNIQRGKVVTLPVTVSGLPSGVSLAITCANAPDGVLCSYFNGVVTVTASCSTPEGTYKPVLVFSSTNMIIAGDRSEKKHPVGILSFSFLPVGILLSCGIRRRIGRRWLVVATFSFFLLLLASCGGGGSTPPHDPPATPLAQSSFSITLNVTHGDCSQLAQR